MTATSTQDPLHWETRFGNRLPALMRSIEALDHHLAAWGASDQTRYLAQLAVEELGTNVLKYGYDDTLDHDIRLRAVWEEPWVRIELEDDGHEFNPCAAREPNADLSLQERTPGGWGISLVRRLAAGMEYERRCGLNVVRITLARIMDAPPA